MNANALDRFRAAVLADPEAAKMLAAHYDPAAFAEAALAWAATHGIALDDEDLERRAPPIETEAWPPTGWLPVSAGNLVEWLNFAGEPLTDPFFEETAQRLAARPFNRLFRYRISLDALIVGASVGVEPSGLIFHMSRCGSTLAAQMLAADPRNLVLSEPPPVDAILLDRDLDDDAKVAALRALASAYMREAPGARLILKLDSWHSRALPLLRRAFPATPWIFLYREPIEVIVSHLRQPGLHAVPGLVPADFVGLGEPNLPGADYIARVLGQICGAVLEHWHLGGGMPIAYREMPEALVARILPHFGIEPGRKALAAMVDAGRRDAKRGGIFASDSDAKRRAAPPEAEAAARLHLAECHARLVRLGR
ncbi:hypothetical protein AB2M62_19225 [Sphingomonas sp. MMS12-HWE2-04]|uniref:hypothetical protein n=1 Tax=Sphingomonas sp. MMS12-HWE2-04 TaxID=3234199 RepID=UPI003850669B